MHYNIHAQISHAALPRRAAFPAEASPAEPLSGGDNYLNGLMPFQTWVNANPLHFWAELTNRRLELC